MANSYHHSGRTKSIPAGLALAVSVSGIMTVILSAVMASFLNNGRISWEEAGYWIMAMLLVSSFIGGRCAYAVIKSQQIVVSLMTGFAYWALLLCITALFFGGKFEAVPETAGIIAAGSVSSALFFKPNIKKTGKRRYGSVVKLNKKRNISK